MINKSVIFSILMVASVNTGRAEATINASGSIFNIDAPITLDIAFDPSVESALLTTPSGPLDLLVMDATDSNPNDGEVSFTELATTTFTYVVTLQIEGEDDESASVNLVVVDPADSPADNVFTTAIKDSSPLFYYRFEEPAGSNYLVDSSGNGLHTDNILGTLTQGSSPGAMQNAGFFNGDTSILVPVTSRMDESFTFSAVMNIDSLELAARQVILAMTDGDLVGRSILYLDDTNFETFISGNAIRFADTDSLSVGGSCLVHFVYNTNFEDIRLYVNGSFRATITTLGSVAANEGNWVIGSHKNRNIQNYEGWLDEFALFESVLTDPEISEHANAFFQAADPLLSFATDRLEIVQGESATLSWKTSDQASTVSLNGSPVDGAGDGGLHRVDVSPSTNTLYTLEVTGPGGPFTRLINVTVVGSEFPTITSFTADSAEALNLTISILAEPNSTYNVLASQNLDDQFSDFITTVTTDSSGVGTETFESFGEKRFYRIEAQ